MLDKFSGLSVKFNSEIKILLEKDPDARKDYASAITVPLLWDHFDRNRDRVVEAISDLQIGNKCTATACSGP